MFYEDIWTECGNYPGILSIPLNTFMDMNIVVYDKCLNLYQVVIDPNKLKKKHRVDSCACNQHSLKDC